MTSQEMDVLLIILQGANVVCVVGLVAAIFNLVFKLPHE